MRQHSISYRYPLLALAMFGLLAGLWGGVERMGWMLPALQPSLMAAHGPVMICGFLGTLISLERAVALDRAWGYLAPAVTGVGGLSIITGIYPTVGAAFITGGSVVLVVIFGVFLRGASERFTQVMSLGAVLWMFGNIAWLAGVPVFHVVYPWMGFLVLTIAGERLELSRMMFHRSVVQRYFVGAAGIFLGGMVVSLISLDGGIRVIGAG
jgi:hypothetical protein